MDALCRCCLAINSPQPLVPLTGILPDIGDAKLTILEVLGTVTSCDVMDSNALPGNICQGCVTRLKNAFNFITMYKDSEISLLNLLMQNNNTKAEDEAEYLAECNVESSGEEEAVERIIIIHEDVELADAIDNKCDVDIVEEVI